MEGGGRRKLGINVLDYLSITLRTKAICGGKHHHEETRSNQRDPLQVQSLNSSPFVVCYSCALISQVCPCPGAEDFSEC